MPTNAYTPTTNILFPKFVASEPDTATSDKFMPKKTMKNKKSTMNDVEIKITLEFSGPNLNVNSFDNYISQNDVYVCLFQQ